MSKKITHGGKRSNAGRLPVADKKVTLSIYPRQSQIDCIGGIDCAKEIALTAIEKKAKIKKS